MASCTISVAKTGMRPTSLIAALVVLLPGSPLLAQVPMGPTFAVNAYTTSSQYAARVAGTAAGDVVVTWCGYGPAEEFLAGRTFDAASGTWSPEFQTGTGLEECHFRPANVGVGAPGYVVVWSRWNVSDRAAFGQRFDWSGQAVGVEFQVNAGYTALYPTVAMNPQGDFLVSWDRQEIWNPIVGQRFDFEGTRVGTEFQVQGTTTAGGFRPTAASAADGRTLVVWGANRGLAARLFDAAGTPLGGVLVISGDWATDASAAFSRAGGFIVVWVNSGSSQVRGRTFDSAGNPLSGEFVIAAATVDTGHPKAASYGHNRYVVSWQSGTPQAFSKRARVFEATGDPHGSDFVVSSTPEYWNVVGPAPQVATDSIGNMTFAWTREVDLDASFGDVMGRRFYGGLVPQRPAVDPASGPSSDANGVLEACETVTFRSGWRNDLGEAQSVTGTLSSFTGPPGATYTIVDGAADYGTLADGSAASCTSDCYAVSVSCANPRPAMHWDATAVETLAVVPQRATWRLHVGDSFSDVPRTSPYYRFVETLLHDDITAGCGGGLYCPASAVTREQMAVFVLLAKEEDDFQPIGCYGTSTFSDVDPASAFCPYIEGLWRRGVVSGCGGGRFCPSDPVTREQMAVFVLRTLDPAISPPACTTPMFADVPASSPFCRWIEELARRGVVAGCGGGNYCPQEAVTREQMAVFLVVSFGLSLYGP